MDYANEHTISSKELANNIMITAMGGKYKKALKLINNKLKYDKKNIDYLQVKAEIFLRMKEFTKSIKTLNKILSKNFYNYEARNILSENYLALKNYNKLLLNTKIVYKKRSLIKNKDKFRTYISYSNALNLNKRKFDALNVLKQGLKDCRYGKKYIFSEMNYLLKQGNNRDV